MHYPKRIISLVPSQTELLYDLGLNDEVTGITKFCIYPNKWFKTKTRIGGTKTVDIEKVKSLKPDLIIANKEENVKEQVEELSKFAPVYTPNIETLDDALHMIIEVGKLVGKQNNALTIIKNIETAFVELKSLYHTQQNLTVAYLIWKDPYMAAGSNTFINNMLHLCGFTNVFSHLERYPAVTIEQIKASGCKLLMLSSEPYPFKQKHINELQPYLPGIKIILADVEMFSWYGSRLQKSAIYFKQLLMQRQEYKT